ncbi:MAG: low temperature requirement protein A [Actinomycetota bacterium]|nr:low temperature requirement protein A [Actinomycetota bacterium]
MALTADLLRHSDEGRNVTNIELFFDLVYVFAITQLSHHLLARTTAIGALETALLLAMVWLVWIYTTWVTNWLDPSRLPVRLMLVALMFGSLVMSAALPQAFAARGLWVGGAYAAMQIGRSIFAIAGMAGDRLQRNFERILAWCVVSGALAVVGGFTHGWIRAGCWIGAVGFDVLGGAVGFYTPGLGRSSTGEWTISGDHMAERCQAFLLIALGESVVVIGSTLSGFHNVSATDVGTLIATFVGVVLLWWVYFDRSADAGASVVARSTDPGRLGRSAYHFVHPIMVAGIIVTAAADERVLAHPTAATDASTAWLVLGGTVLFLAGHAAFKATLWRVVPCTRLVAIAVLGLLGLGATLLPVVALGALADAVVVLLVVSDRKGARQDSRNDA